MKYMRLKIKGLLISITLWISLFLIFTTATAQNTLYVDDDGTTAYTSIQDAITAASTNDIIFVYNGTYHECIYIWKQLVVIGENPKSTIIDGVGNSYVVSLRKHNISIHGFTIQNGQNGIKLEGTNKWENSDNIISNNIITRNSNGILIYGQPSLKFFSERNIIKNNEIYENLYNGIQIIGSFNNTIENNTLHNHANNGIALGHKSNYNLVINNTIVQSGNWGVGISGFHNIIRNNTIREALLGIILNGQNNQVYNNIINDNLIIHNRDAGIYSDNAYNNFVIKNNISSNLGVGIELYKSDQNIFSENEISYNKRFGLHLIKSNENHLENNNCSSNFIAGIVLENTTMNIISNCTIHNHTNEGILLHQTSRKNEINQCSIFDNWVGIKSIASDNNAIKQSEIKKNYWGIKLAESKKNTIEQNRVSDNFCAIMRGKHNRIYNNDFFENKYFVALGTLTHRNLWMRNYYNHHISSTPFYLFGFNIDLFPRVEPLNYL